MARSSSGQRCIWILLLDSDHVVLRFEHKMLAEQVLQILALAIVEENSQEDLQVPGSNTDMSQNIRIVA